MIENMSDAERTFLVMLGDKGSRICRDNPPSLGIQSLEKRGYVRLSKARNGPLGVYTGEVMVALSEAGALVVSRNE